MIGKKSCRFQENKIDFKFWDESWNDEFEDYKA